MTSPKDPYHGFKSDRDRLWALISRDVRMVLMAWGLAAFGGHAVLPSIVKWISVW